MNRTTIFSLIFLLSQTVTASGHDAWTGARQVQSIQVVGHGGFLITLDGEIGAECSYSGTDSLMIYPNQGGVTDAGARSLLSTALIAFSTGNKVNIMYSNHTEFCWGSQLTITK